MSFAFIRKRSKNYIVYLEYKDENSGKKIQKNMGSFEKKRDASRKLNELKDSIFNDELILPNALNLENFLIDFLDKHKINLSITTYNCYLRICKKYIIPMLGKYKLEELKAIHVQNYVDDLVGILAPQTIKIHINILNLALKLIKENIIDCIEVPKVKKFKNNIYNKTNMFKLLQVCKGTPLELQIYLACGLGLRISEVLGLTWDNIDFNENTITINKITVRDNNLDHIRFHDLRHSHVTLLINSKVPIKVISERVGHSNINTTLNIYAHTLKEMDSEASDKISEILFNLG